MPWTRAGGVRQRAGHLTTNRLVTRGGAKGGLVPRVVEEHAFQRDDFG
jgi:hypothetical protein